MRALRALARDPAARAEARACLAEGPRVIRAALERGAEVSAAYVGYGAAPAFAPLLDELRAAGVPIHPLKEGVLEKIGTTRTPQPVLVTVEWSPRPLTDVVAGAVATAGFVVVAADVADPGNLGTILRGAEAAGAAGVVVAGSGVDVRSPKVVRASAGALFGLPVALATDVADALAELRAAGIRCVGAVARGGVAPAAAGLADAAIVVGNEARGLSGDAAAHLDGTVTIPMAGAAESLNVAMAATVLCFEAARQRAASPGKGGP